MKNNAFFKIFILCLFVSHYVTIHPRKGDLARTCISTNTNGQFEVNIFFEVLKCNKRSNKSVY